MIEMPTVALLEPPYFDAQWGFLERELDRVPHIWQDRFTKEALYEAVIRHRVQVWTAGDRELYRLVVFTQLVDFPAGRSLEVFLTFGNSFVELLPALEATLTKFSIDMKCTRVDIVGRKGFEKFLRPFGFVPDAVILSRRVEPQGVH